MAGLKQFTDESLEFRADPAEVVIAEGLTVVALHQISEALLHAFHAAVGPKEFVIRIQIEGQLAGIGHQVSGFDASSLTGDCSKTDGVRGGLEWRFAFLENPGSYDGYTSLAAASPPPP